MSNERHDVQIDWASLERRAAMKVLYGSNTPSVGPSHSNVSGPLYLEKFMLERLQEALGLQPSSSQSQLLGHRLHKTSEERMSEVLWQYRQQLRNEYPSALPELRRRGQMSRRLRQYPQVHLHQNLNRYLRYRVGIQWRRLNGVRGLLQVKRGVSPTPLLSTSWQPKSSMTLGSTTAYFHPVVGRLLRHLHMILYKPAM